MIVPLLGASHLQHLLTSLPPYLSNLFICLNLIRHLDLRKKTAKTNHTLINPTMFSSFSSFSNPFGVPRFLGGNPGTAIDLNSVEIHHVETQNEKRARTLKHLLKLNHANHSIVYHDLEFHNHMPHVRVTLLTQLFMAELIQEVRSLDPPTLWEPTRVT